MSALFPIILWEMVLGGGGRIFALGPLPTRMLLFAAAVVLWTALAIKHPRRTSNEWLALQLIVLFFIAHIPGVVRGVMAGYKVGTIVGELQPLLYWMIAPFFAMNLSRIENIERASRIIMRGGLTVSLASLLIVLGLLAGVIPATLFYQLASGTQEFVFRGTTSFFYKGYFYVMIAAVFMVALRPRRWAFWTLLLTITLVASLTRGLILGLILGVMVVFLAQRRWRVLGWGVIGLILLGVVFAGRVSISDLADMGDRVESVSQRLDDTLYIIREMDAMTILFGEGLGSLINMRTNIENSYMWAVWKLGVFGLAFWLLPLCLSGWYFLRVPFASTRYNLAVAYFAGVMTLYGVTATNPFVNNPIGLSYLMIALFSLRTLAIAEAPVPPARRG